MKKINYILIMTVLSLFSACQDEDAIRVPEIADAPNVRFQWDPLYGFINFDDLENTFVRYDLFSESTNIETVELQTIYASVSGTNDTAIVKTYTQADFNSNSGAIYDEDISANDLATAFGITLADFSGGDSFIFNNITTLTDGTVYPSPTINGNSNVSPTIVGQSATASFTTSNTAYVGCPSDASSIVGTYMATIVTQNSAGNPPFGLPNTSSREVTVTTSSPEPFRYTVSSHDAGWWARPDVTATEAGPGDFYDICGTTIMQPITSFGFGGANHFPGGAGSIDPNTGVITLNWYNSFNDIYGYVTLTPVED